MPAFSMPASTRCTGSSMSFEQRRGVDPCQFGVQRVGQIDDRSGAQNLRLHRLVVDAVAVVEQRQLHLLGIVGAQFPAQVPQRQVLERETALTRANQVRGKSGVGCDPAQLPPAGRQVVHCPLRLMRGLRLVLVGQPAARAPSRRRASSSRCRCSATRRRRRRSRPQWRHRRPPCACRPPTGPLCARRRRVLPASRATPPGSKRAAADVEPLVDLGLDGRQRVEQPVAQHPEFQIVEQPVDLVAVPRLHAQHVGRLGQRHVAHKICQLTVQHHVRKVGAQRIADFALAPNRRCRRGPAASRTR